MCWLSVILAFRIRTWTLARAVLRVLQLRERCAASVARQQRCTVSFRAGDTVRPNWRSRPGNASPNPRVTSSVSWNYRHSYVSAHSQLWPRQWNIERPRSTVIPFFFLPPRKENTHPCTFVFYFSPPFLFLYKDLSPPGHNCVPPFLCGQDGGWWELTSWWYCPQRGANGTAGMPCVHATLGLTQNTMQSASLWKEVEGNPKEYKNMENNCVEVDCFHKNQRKRLHL